jgi:hypothetical protein
VKVKIFCVLNRKIGARRYVIEKMEIEISRVGRKYVSAVYSEGEIKLKIFASAQAKGFFLPDRISELWLARIVGSVRVVKSIKQRNNLVKTRKNQNLTFFQ